MSYGSPTVNVDMGPVVRAISDMSSRLGSQLSSVQQLLSALDGKFITVAQAIQQLHRINEEITHAVRQQTQMQKNIQLIKSKAALDTAQERHTFAQADLKRKEHRYKTQYGNIINNYVDGIIQNIKHFLSLAHEELAPLHKLIDQTNRVSDIIGLMNPEREDKVVIDNALNQFNERMNNFRDVVVSTFKISENKISSYTGLQKEMQEKFNNININLPALISKLKYELSILNIPLFIIELSSRINNSEPNSYLFLGPSQVSDLGAITINATTGTFEGLSVIGNVRNDVYLNVSDMSKITDGNDILRIKENWKREKREIRKISDKGERKKALKQFNLKVRLQKIQILPDSKFNKVYQPRLTSFIKPVFPSLSSELNNFSFFTQEDFNYFSSANLMKEIDEEGILKKAQKDPEFRMNYPKYLFEILERITRGKRSFDTSNIIKEFEVKPSVVPPKHSNIEEVYEEDEEEPVIIELTEQPKHKAEMSSMFNLLKAREQQKTLDKKILESSKKPETVSTPDKIAPPKIKETPLQTSIRKPTIKEPPPQTITKEAPKLPSLNKCPTCGQSLLPSDKICVNCGRVLKR